LSQEDIEGLFLNIIYDKIITWNSREEMYYEHS
jgi:hypothetical protein